MIHNDAQIGYITSGVDYPRYGKCAPAYPVLVNSVGLPYVEYIGWYDGTMALGGPYDTACMPYTLPSVCPVCLMPIPPFPINPFPARDP